MNHVIQIPILFGNIRNATWTWMDLEKDKDQQWFSGRFYIDDHEIETIGPTSINPSDYIDMTPSGDTLKIITDFAANSTNEEKSGMYYI